MNSAGDYRYYLEEIRHFFEAYKELEPGKFSEVRGWEGRAEAETEIAAAFERELSSPS